MRTSFLGRVLVVVVAALVGFVIVSQFRGQRRFSRQLQAESETDLARIVDDPEHSLRYDALIDLVQELRDAGAEALAVNGQRIGASSAFFTQSGAIALDGSALHPPYRVVAIGDPATLEAGLTIRGGAVETLTAARGVHVNLDRQSDVTLPALARPPTLRAAHPVAS